VLTPLLNRWFWIKKKEQDTELVIALEMIGLAFFMILDATFHLDSGSVSLCNMSLNFIPCSLQVNKSIF
jgi:hypothetical protein